MKILTASFALPLMLICTSTYGATTIAIEDFEDATVLYSTSVAEFSDGSYDFWTRTDGTNIGSAIVYNGLSGSSYFAGSDLDGEGATPPLVQTFSGITITDYINLDFSVLLAEDDEGSNQDWDQSDDIVSFEYQIDGGGYSSLFDVVGQNFTSGAFNGEPFVGATAVTDTFAAFTSSIGGTGDTLDIRITWDLDSGDEDLAIDDLKVTGDLVPEPTTTLLGALGLIALLRRKR